MALKKFMAVLAQVRGPWGPSFGSSTRDPCASLCSRCCACLEESARPLPGARGQVQIFGPTSHHSPPWAAALWPQSRAPSSPRTTSFPVQEVVTWHQMRRGIFPFAHICLPVSSAQAEPGLWPLTPQCDYSGKEKSPHSEGMRASLSLFFPLSDSELEGAPLA